MPGNRDAGVRAVEVEAPRRRRKIPKWASVASAALVFAGGGVLVGPAPALAAPISGPGNVTAVGGRKLIRVSWTAPSAPAQPVTSYVASVNTGESCTTASLTCDILNVPSNTSLTVSVKACPSDLANCSLPTTMTSTVKAGPPAAPAAPTVTYQPDNTSVRVSWVAPDTGVGILNYRVTPSPTAGLSGTCMSPVPAGTTSCDLTGLSAGTTYTFKVLAVGVSTSGTSPSSPATTKIAGPPGTPAAPTATRVSDTSVRVSWDKPAGPEVRGYQVQTISNGNVVSDVGCSAGADVTECTVTGLSQVGDYTFKVQALGEAPNGGVSDFSAASDAVRPGMPGTPAAPTVELGSAAGQVIVSWEAPEGGTVTSYTVTAVSEDGAVPDPCTVEGTVRRCAFADLTDGAAYTFTVTATNAAGFTTSAASDPIVSELPAKPAKPEATLEGSGRVQLTWDPPVEDEGGPVVYYTVSAIPATGEDTGTQTPGCGVNLAAPSCEFTDLDPTVSYRFRVTAVGDLGSVESNLSDAIVPGPPGAPMNPAVELGDGAGEATVTWAAPVGGGAVVGYTVTVGPSVGEATDSDCVPAEDAGTFSCAVTGLSADQTYVFRVVASNTAGDAGITAVPGGDQIPGAPTAVEVALVAAEPGQATVSWVAPVDGLATRYTVVGEAEGSGVDPEPCVVQVTECLFDELDPEESYTFVVRAENILGGTSAVETAAIVPDEPGTPRTAAAEVTGDGEVTVTWDPPAGGGAVETYTVVADPGNGTPPGDSPCTVTLSENDPLECVFTGMDSDEAYTFSVTAENAAGTSSAATTDPVVPGAPGTPVVTVTLGDDPGELTVTWTEPAGGAVSTYTVVATASGGVTPPADCTVTPPAARQCVYTGLTETSDYSFVVTASNGVDDVSAAATDPVKPDQPGVPTDVDVALVTGTPGALRVTWAEPDDGGAVRDYTVTATATGGVTPPAPCTVVPSEGDPLRCDYTDLPTNASYRFTVSANNAAGETPATATEAIVPNEPGAPRNVQVALGAEPGSVLVIWDDPASGGAVDTYTVAVASEDDQSLPADCTVTPPEEENSCEFGDLDLDAAYSFTVTATNVAGATAATTTDPVVPNAPTEPGSPSGEVVGIGTVRLTWAPSDGGGPVASYTVTAYDVADPGTPIPAPTGCVEVDEVVDDDEEAVEPYYTCEFSGLDQRTYVFTVTANGAGGASTVSSRSEEVDLAGPEAPGAPTVELAGANAVRVTWTAPEGGGPVLSYSVTSNPAVAPPAGCTNTKELTCLFDKLISGAEYTFTVTATGTVDRTAAGEPSASVVVGPPDAPARPTVAPGDTATSVTVSWAAPSPGAGIAGYTVQSVPGRLGCAVAADADATSCVVTGLTADTRYTFRVQANGVTGAGDSAFSPASESIVPQAPGRPVDVDVLAGNRQISVSWSAHQPTIDRVAGYRAVASPGGGSCETASSTETECVIDTELTNLTSYRVTVVALGIDELGQSPASEPSARVRPTAGAPGSPTGVQAVAGNGVAVVSWTAPAVTGDGIARYQVTAAHASETHTCVTANGTTLRCTVEGLTNGREYRFTVVAVGRAASGYSTPSTAATATPRTPPGVPANVSVTAGVRTLAVRWTANGAGAGLAGFTATATGGTAPLSCTVTGATATTCTIANVTPGTYAVTVVANGTQAGIVSAPSEPVEATALLALAPAVPSTAPTGTSVLGPLTVSAGSARQGGTVTVEGVGFAPFTGVALGLSGGVRLGTATTNANGSFTATVTVPATTTVGAKTIIAAALPPTGTTVRYRTSAFSVTSATAPQIAAAQRTAREMVVLESRAR